MMGGAAPSEHSPAQAAEIHAPGETGAHIVALLLREKRISEEQLAYAQRIHGKLPSRRTLLSVLEELHVVTEEQVRETLRAHPLAVPLGSLLVELGYLREDELRTAVALQKDRPGVRLGQILVESRLLDEEKLCQALSFQLGYEYVPLATTSVDLDLVRSVPGAALRNHLFLPVARRDGRVLVAFADPLDKRALESARRVLGADVLPAIAARTGIAEALARVERGRERSVVAANESATVATVNQLIAEAAARGASDIHIEPMRDRLRVRFRQDGVLATARELPLDMAAPLASRIKILAGADISERRRHQDGRILFEHEAGTLDLRFSSYVTVHGEAIVLRLLNNAGKTVGIREIGMAPRVLQRFVEDALDCPSGVIIVTGPTGSGKTTTLYAAIQYLNDPHTSIITAEDPVEYVVDGISQCSINPKIQVTYEDTLKHIVRQDPDVIIIGEIRDTFSAETAIQAALTGHKVLTTFHTEDSIGGLVRLLNMNIEAFLISSTVVSVLAQRLLRRVCPHCSEARPVTPQQARRLGYEPKDLAGVSFRHGEGCVHCGFSGYKGRLPVFELLVLNELVKDAVISRKPSFDIRRISVESTGLVTLFEDGIIRATCGETSFEEVMRHLPRLGNPRPLGQLRRLLGDA
jgi:type IV pilus assembly protein PilB